MKRISKHRSLQDEHMKKAIAFASHDMMSTLKTDEKAKQNFNRKPFYLVNDTTMPPQHV